MRTFLWLGILGCLANSPLLAQQARPDSKGAVFYRDGQAPVVAPQQVEAMRIDQPVGAFGEHYKSAGRPRIALFWNVALTDSLANEKVKQSTTVGSASKSTNAVERAVGSKDNQIKNSDANERVNTTNVVTQREFEVSRSRRQMSQLTESDAWRIETGFASKMSEAGVRFVDRDTIMRLTHVKDGDGTNSQMVESKALVGMADLILEILSTRDAQAKSGYGFRVTLRDLKTGQQRAAFYSQATPEVPAPERRFVAGAGGYVLAPEPVVRIDEVGGALALDAMRELLGRLR